MQTYQRQLLLGLALTFLLAWDVAFANPRAVVFVCQSAAVSIEVQHGGALSEDPLAALLHANLVEGEATSDDVVRVLEASGIVSAYQEEEREGRVFYTIQEDPSVPVIRQWLVLPPKGVTDLAKILAVFGPAAADVWSHTLSKTVRTAESWRAYRALSAAIWPEDEFGVSVHASGHDTEAAVRLVVWNGLLDKTRYSFRHSGSKSALEALAAAARQGLAFGPEMLDLLSTAARAIDAAPADRARLLWQEAKGAPGDKRAFLGLTKALALEANQEELWLKATFMEKDVAWDSMAERLTDRATRDKVAALGSSVVEQALRSAPNDAALWLTKGDMATAAWALRGASLNPAEAAYGKASQLAPSWYLPHARLAEIYGYRSDWQRCMGAFEKAVAAPMTASKHYHVAKRFIFAALVIGPRGAGEEIADSLVDRAILDRSSAEDSLALGFEALGRYKKADAHWQASAHGKTTGFRSPTLAAPERHGKP